MVKTLKRANIKTNLECREIEGKRIIVGLLPYNTRSVNMNWRSDDEEDAIFEVIDSTAFDKTINDGAEVRALYSHNDEKILGSTKSGTLKLESTELGLICTCELPNTQYGNDAWEIIQRGDCKTMSFGFIPYTVERKQNENHLKSVQLIEVSFCVASPAYPDTDSIAELRNWAVDTHNEAILRSIENMQKTFNGEETECHSNDQEQAKEENPMNEEIRNKINLLLKMAEVELM